MKKIIGKKNFFSGASRIAIAAILGAVFTVPAAFAMGSKDPGPATPPAVETKKTPAPLEDLQKKASLERGRKMVINKCVDCHTFDEDGPDRYGPNLFGIVGKKYAHKKGYPYSKALLAEAAKGKIWDDKELHNWLENPPKYIVGTKMLDGQISDETSRDDIINYLKTIK